MVKPGARSIHCSTVTDERRLSRPDSIEIPPAPLRSPPERWLTTWSSLRTLTDWQSKPASCEGPAGLCARWTLLTACGPDQARRNHAWRASLHAPPRPSPAERDRDAPSPPVVLDRSVSRPPTVGLAPPRCETFRAEGDPDSSSGNSSLEPSECRICPSGDTQEQLRNKAWISHPR